MSLEEQVASKHRELEALKKITQLTDGIKSQLDGLAEEVGRMESNADVVAQVMSNWDSVKLSIAQATLTLAQYAQQDYEVGVWANTSQEEHNKGDEDEEEEEEKKVPMPEPQIRFSLDT